MTTASSKPASWVHIDDWYEYSQMTGFIFTRDLIGPRSGTALYMDYFHNDELFEILRTCTVARMVMLEKWKRRVKVRRTPDGNAWGRYGGRVKGPLVGVLGRHGIVSKKATTRRRLCT